MTCLGRYVSDKLRDKIYKGDTEQHYHIPIICKRPAFEKNELCIKCIEKEERYKRININGKVPNKFHTSVLHGKNNEPIPSWSRCENSEWFKNMLSKGYMAKKKDVQKKESDSKIINDYISTLDGKGSDKIIKLIEKFPSLSKTAALKCISDYNKLKKNPINVVSLKEPVVVNSKPCDELYDVLEVQLEARTIDNTKYLYDTNKNKVYTTEFKYVGRYNILEETLHTDYPDSDAEPSFTT